MLHRIAQSLRFAFDAQSRYHHLLQLLGCNGEYYFYLISALHIDLAGSVAHIAHLDLLTARRKLDGEAAIKIGGNTCKGTCDHDIGAWKGLAFGVAHHSAELPLSEKLGTGEEQGHED